MSPDAIPLDHARRAYDVFASFYDDFTSDHDYDQWVGKVETLVRQLNPPGHSVLDVGCGTGSSFAPLLARGYSITAVDISPAMVEAARQKVGDAVRLHVEDMRALPALGRFDVVWCLGEAVNYLQTERELLAAFGGARRNLRAGGIFVLDTVSLGTFRSLFSSLSVSPSDDRVLVLDGKGSPELDERGSADVSIERLVRDDAGWRRERCMHHHRHHSGASVRAALKRSGFELMAVRGSTHGEPLDPVADELRHAKVVFAARAGGRATNSSS